MKGNVFIKRPVMAISISVLILAIGLISLFTLPVEQYPDIAPPTVYVTASYTGADAEAVPGKKSIFIIICSFYSQTFLLYLANKDNK